MIKCVRKAFAPKRKMIDGDGGIIDWNFIVVRTTAGIKGISFS